MLAGKARLNQIFNLPLLRFKEFKRCPIFGILSIRMLKSPGSVEISWGYVNFQKYYNPTD